MAAQAIWASKEPTPNHNASCDIGDATSAKVALESSELCASGLPCIVGNSAALRRVLEIVRIVAASTSVCCLSCCPIGA